MLDRLVHLFRSEPAGAQLHWLTSDIAIGSAGREADWEAVYGTGVRAVVDVRESVEDVGVQVRENGMRYLSLSIKEPAVISAEELQIAASWVVDRTAENSRVLIQDGNSRFDDALVAVASLIKGGLPAHLALLALRRAVPNHWFNSAQNLVLVKFASAVAGAGPR